MVWTSITLSSPLHCLGSATVVEKQPTLQYVNGPWSSLVGGDVTECQPKGYCVYKVQKIRMQPMHGNIPQMFDNWSDLIFRLLLLKILPESATI